jgi:hypothetical protein
VEEEEAPAEGWWWEAPAEAPEEAPAPAPPAAPAEEAHAPVPERAEAPARTWEVVPRALVRAYAVCAVLALGWWLLGHAALWWSVRDRASVPPVLEALFAEMTAGGPRPRLVVSRRARVPFSYGALRPTLVMPARFAWEAPEGVLRWVLAHELAHLGRRDAVGGTLFGLGQGLFFFLPWFWWLRREVRLCQEYLADEAAAGAGGARADYAEFLVSWLAAPALPSGATGVSGRPSELFRRVSMLLQGKSPLESRCPRAWSLRAAGGLLGLAVLAAGVSPVGRAEEPRPREEDRKAPAKDVEKPAPKPGPGKDAEKPAPKKEEKAGRRPDVPALPDIDDLLKKAGQGLTPAQERMVRLQLEMARRQMEQALRLAERLRQVRPVQPWPGRFPGRLGRPTSDARLGVQVRAPSETLVQQLELRQGQGLVVEEVAPNLPAAKAGMKRHDVLLELAGKTVPSQEDALGRLVGEIKADQPVNAVVLRKGKREAIKGLTLPKVEERRPGVRPRPGVRLPALPRLPAVPRPGANRPANDFSMTTVQRTGDQFTVRHQELGASVTVQGTVTKGKVEVKEITIGGRGRPARYDNLGAVPQEWRDKVKALLELVPKIAPAKGRGEA